MRRLWLTFTQAVTVCLAVIFVITTLRPEWMQQAPEPAVHVEPPVAPPASADAPASDDTWQLAGDVSEPGDPLQADTPVFSYAQAVERAVPSVVSVYTRKHIKGGQRPYAPGPDVPDRPGLGSRAHGTSLGSGVIVRDDGYILTNYHVVKAADAIEVTLADARQGSAALVGADPESDLAVIKVDLPGLAAIAMGDDTALRVGDVVLAIGNPFGVGQTTTMGIVSALGRNRLGVDIYENFIQTDAAINPGNSGGALVDASGLLVGINTAMYSESGGSLGIGFAIPARAAHLILDEIIEKGHVARGWLGVEPQDITADLAQAFGLDSPDGVILARVQPDGPADKAGLKVGDIIVMLDEYPVTDAVQFLGLVAAHDPDESVMLHVLHDGEHREMHVRLGERSPVTDARP